METIHRVRGLQICHQFLRQGVQDVMARRIIPQHMQLSGELLGLARPIGLEDRGSGEGRAHGCPVCLGELRRS